MINVYYVNINNNNNTRTHDTNLCISIDSPVIAKMPRTKKIETLL